MDLRWYITSEQYKEHGPYTEKRTLQYFDIPLGEWTDVEDVMGDSIKFDGDIRRGDK